MELTCPKCQGAMRNYERNGVHVDQCTDCRGIFLDRGELEKLVDAENTFYAPAGASSGAAASPAPAAGEQRGSGDQLGRVVTDALRQASSSRGSRSHGGSYDSHGYPRKKKSSFLDELFG